MGSFTDGRVKNNNKERFTCLITMMLRPLTVLLHVEVEDVLVSLPVTVSGTCQLSCRVV